MIRKIPEYKKKSKIFKNKLYVLIRVSVSNSKLLYFFSYTIIKFILCLSAVIKPPHRHDTSSLRTVNKII